MYHHFVVKLILNEGLQAKLVISVVDYLFVRNSGHANIIIEQIEF